MRLPTDARDGHTPTLIACFAHFDVCFMLWVLIGALSATIFDGTRMDAALKGLVVGLPILMGSALRVPLGLLSDRIGGRDEAYHKKVDLAFRQIATEEPERVRIVDASGRPKVVTARLLDALQDLLP